MGTQFRLTFYATPDRAAEAAEKAFQRIQELERICSDYLPDSELTRLSQSTVPFSASADLFTVITRAQDIAQLTAGAFDITCGHYSQLWRRAKRKGTLPTTEQLAKAKSLSGWQKIHLDAEKQQITLSATGMQLDLGGIAKGYAADAALKVLKELGITSAVVAASGDFAIGEPPPGQTGWEITVRAFPGDEQKLTLSHCGVSTSGDLHQHIELNGVRYSHIIDPETGLGLTRQVSASIIAPSAALSDALATAACAGKFQLPKEAALRLVTPEKVITTANWPKSTRH
jgi:FAD:protein FMN transferase